jgi:hypothetical protein
LTQGASLRQYDNILAQQCPLSFFCTVHSLSYLRLPLSPSHFSSPFPSSSPFVSPSVSQQMKIIEKGKVQRTIRTIPPVDKEIDY